MGAAAVMGKQKAILAQAEAEEAKAGATGKKDFKAAGKRAEKRIGLATKALGHAKQHMAAAEEKVAAAKALAKKYPTPENLAKLEAAVKIQKEAKTTLTKVNGKVEKYRKQERTAKEKQVKERLAKSQEKE